MSCADLCCADMVKGQSYTFHFSYAGYLQVPLDPAAVQNTVAKDSNFQSPSAVVSKGGLNAAASVKVSFTYQGCGSLVGQAGQEMQNVINNFWLTGLGTSVVFAGAELGVTLCPCGNDNSSGVPWWLWVGLGVAVLVFVAPEIFEFEILKKLGRSARA